MEDRLLVDKKETITIGQQQIKPVLEKVLLNLSKGDNAIILLPWYSGYCIKGDGENIPYPDNYFDAITVAYGVRNFENLEKGLTDILRTLKPGGQLIILETSVPTQFPFKQGYYVYTNFIMPTIGKLFSKDKKAYQYLSTSAQNFPFGEALNNILRKMGFIDVKHLPQTFGVATIYQASKK